MYFFCTDSCQGIPYVWEVHIYCVRLSEFFARWKYQWYQHPDEAEQTSTQEPCLVLASPPSKGMATILNSEKKN